MEEDERPAGVFEVTRWLRLHAKTKWYGACGKENKDAAPVQTKAVSYRGVERESVRAEQTLGTV